MRVAFSSMAWNTGSSSPGELLMTFKHVGGRGLLLQRFRQVARLRLHLVEQTDVADGDHGLIGEGLKQGNLLFAERMNFGAAKYDSANAFAFAQQRHAEDGAMTHAARQLAGHREIGAFSSDRVCNVHRRPGRRHARPAIQRRLIGHFSMPIGIGP